MPPRKNKKKAPAKKPSSEPLIETFEESLEEIETIVSRLEGGELGLDESLSEYERAVRRLKHCYRLIESSEQKIELLQNLDEEGRTVTSELDAEPNEGWVDGENDSEKTLAAKAQKRGKLRSRPAQQASPDNVDSDPGLF